MKIAKEPLKGGEFLLKASQAEDIFIPENWNEEQVLIGATCQEFIHQKIVPVLNRIDAQEEGLMEKLLEQAGELGLLAIAITEEYGGFGKDLITSILVAEKTGPGCSFAIAAMVHSGVGTLPILYYGNEEQKKKYLPRLASGEWKGAYCLTEPDAGPDANAGKTRARLSLDGRSYMINGQKMWITNAGFANVFVVFAKIEDDKNLSAFIVEKNTTGLLLSAEEQKTGLKGSSTRQLFFNDCRVPAENLLGIRGQGFKIALNTLNLGRIRLGAVALGYAKSIITTSVRYANTRVQFGQQIAKFGSISSKLAEQAIHAYATESAIYRVSKNIEDTIQNMITEGLDPSEAKLKGAESFAVEAAIIKVHASEALDFIVDEGVQIFGGMGYSAEAPMDRAYRDSRVYRIFEGTNEINRILIVDIMRKRSLKGQFDLLAEAKKAVSDCSSTRELYTHNLFDTERNCIANFKKAALLIIGAAEQKLTMEFGSEQEIVCYLSDILIDTYVSESLQLRVEKLAGQRGETQIIEQLDMMQVYLRDAADRIYKAGKEVLNTLSLHEDRAHLLNCLKNYTETKTINSVEARRRITARLTKENKYCF